MNEALVANHNAVVAKDDTVYWLGDISFTNHENTEAILARMNGKKFLVKGNHDKQPVVTSKHLTLCPPLHDITIEGVHVVLCHFPLLSWNRSGHGSFHLHGHTHGGLVFDPKVRRQDVGVDVWGYAPVAWETIRTKLNAVPTPSYGPR